MPYRILRCSLTCGACIRFLLCDALNTTKRDHASSLQRVVPEFEAAIDPDPERGSLYRVLAAYACLDPHTGYVQGMNFIAALLVTPTVLAQQNASSPTSALASTKTEEGSSSAVTTITTTATAAAAAPASFQGCPLSMEDERAAFELFVRLMQASGLRRVFDARDDQLHCLLMRLEFHVEGFLPFLHEHLNQVIFDP